MDASTDLVSHQHAAHTDHHHGDDHDHHELGWWRKYVFSTDHKVIGIQYGISGLTFLFFGFCIMMVMRWQLAYPGKALPVIGPLLNWIGPGTMPDGIMQAEFYNSLGAMHGTIMIFLGVVPVAFAAFGNYVVPLQIGAPDMTFPKINMASFWAFIVGGIIMLASFWVPGGAAKGGWTSYTPLSVIADKGPTYHWLWNGQNMWLIAFVFLITSSLLGAVNFIATIIQLRAKGLTWMRLPFFVWAQFVTAFILLLAFPPLEAAAVMQLMDRLAATSFFMPTGLVVNGAALNISGGGSSLLWQHLFWFLGHPEVYVLILPAMGIVGEILANNTRKPLWGYKSLVFALLVLAFLSFIVWAHHMWLTGMGSVVSAFFQTTTVIISIPSVIILSAFFISLWGGSIRFNTPMLFATAFLPMFGIGGLTGIPLAFSSADLFLHDTYYVIALFHYIVAPGTIFGLFAGVYYWYPKATGRRMSEFWGKVHFWPSLICMNVIFLPMFNQGMLSMHRRWYDGGQGWNLANEKVWGLTGFQWNVPISIAAWIMGLAQIPFIINFFWSMRRGEKVGDNPWEATTLEWTAPTPPPHGNFAVTPVAHRGPYEYSLPGRERDFTMQNEPVNDSDRRAYAAAAAAHN
ncbi:MAG: cbb3-type cytochrome c oxidase subunit I [Chthoniobacterales bacterium]|nr:cbb3-type cytochrome c oxidase subunit I [Chthoniobacterales bacterium]